MSRFEPLTEDIPMLENPSALYYSIMREGAKPPMRATPHSAGFDISSWQDVTIRPDELVHICTGIAVEIPLNHVGLLNIRSGLSKLCLTLANGTGIIDSDYRGELGVLAWNFGVDQLHIWEGDRIAQLTIVPCPDLHPKQRLELSSTERGEGGFGSTGRDDIPDYAE